MSSETITKEGIEESNLYLQKCEAELKDKYDYTLLSKIAKLGDKKFVYEYLKANIDKIKKT